MITIIIIVTIYMCIMVDEYSFAPVVMRHAQVAINVNLLWQLATVGTPLCPD